MESAKSEASWDEAGPRWIWISIRDWDAFYAGDLFWNICQWISFTCASLAPSPKKSFARQGFLFRFLSPRRRWKLKSSWVKWQLAIISSFLHTSRYLMHYYATFYQGKTDKAKTYPRERGDCWSISHDLVLMISHQSPSKIHAYEHAWCVPAARITNEPITKLCVQNITSLPTLRRTWCEPDTCTSWKFLKIAQNSSVFFAGCRHVRK